MNNNTTAHCFDTRYIVSNENQAAYCGIHREVHGPATRSQIEQLTMEWEWDHDDEQRDIFAAEMVQRRRMAY